MSPQVARAMPWMVVLMVVEGLVNHFIRRKEHNLGDTITRSLVVLVLVLVLVLVM